MTLNARQRAHLRSLGHGLRPTMIVGKEGVTTAAISYLEGLLETAELVKVRVGTNAPEDTPTVAQALVTRTGAEMVGRQGHVMLLFRRSREKPSIQLPERHDVDDDAATR